LGRGLGEVGGLKRGKKRGQDQGRAGVLAGGDREDVEEEEDATASRVSASLERRVATTCVRRVVELARGVGSNDEDARRYSVKGCGHIVRRLQAPTVVRGSDKKWSWQWQQWPGPLLQHWLQF